MGPDKGSVGEICAPSQAATTVRIHTPGSERENETFGRLNNAVLQLLERTFDIKQLKDHNKSELAEQIRIRAAQVVESLKIHVRDELDALQKEEIGQLKLREQKLMGELAAEHKKNKAQQLQLEAFKSALEEIRVMHAEEKSSLQADSAMHFQGEMERVNSEHAAEVKRLKGMIMLASQAASSISNKAENLKAHYAQSEEYHSHQVSKLQSEVDAHRAIGNEAEANARQAYLDYHQQELDKTPGIAIGTSAATSMKASISALKERYAAELEASKAEYVEKMAQDAEALRSEYQAELERLKAALVQKEGELADTLGRQKAAASSAGEQYAAELEASKAEYVEKVARDAEALRMKYQAELEQNAAELEASKAEYAEKVAQDAEALRTEYQAELERLKAALAQKEGELADTLGRQKAAAAAALELDAIKEQHAATLAKLKEEHRVEMYHIQAKQQKLQRELSLRLDPLTLSSQESLANATLKRSRMDGRTLARNPAPQEPPKPEDPFASAQEELMRQMADLEEHYEEMDAKRGKWEEYPKAGAEGSRKRWL